MNKLFILLTTTAALNFSYPLSVSAQSVDTNVTANTEASADTGFLGKVKGIFGKSETKAEISDTEEATIRNDNPAEIKTTTQIKADVEAKARAEARGGTVLVENETDVPVTLDIEAKTDDAKTSTENEMKFKVQTPTEELRSDTTLDIKTDAGTKTGKGIATDARMNTGLDVGVGR